MKIRTLAVLSLSILVAACAAESGEPAPEPEPAPESEPAADPAADAEAALVQLAADYEQHYNLHHPDMVADFFLEDGVALLADGSVLEGRAAIAADLEADMAASPTAEIEPVDWMVFGDNAVGRGTYELTMTPEGGESMSTSGSWMGLFQRSGEEWKIYGLVSNNDAPPEGEMPEPTLPAEQPEELVDGPAAQLIAAYVEHYNQGHASQVAALYADNAVAAFADTPWVQGRTDIEAHLTETMAEGSPQLSVHDVDTVDLGDGWFADGGMYEIAMTMDGNPVRRVGSYATLGRTAADGTTQIHWFLTNSRPAEPSSE